MHCEGIAFRKVTAISSFQSCHIDLVFCVQKSVIKMAQLNKLRLIISAARPHLLRGGWASADALIAPAALFFLSPWLLLRLGTEGFGQWVLALTISGFAHVASLGAGVATMYAVADFNAKNEKEKLVNTIKTGFSLALVTSLVLMAFAWFAVAPIVNLVFLKMGDSHTVAVVLLLGISALALQEIDSVFSGTLRGIQRYDLVALLELLGRPIWAVCIAVVAYTTSNVVSVLIAHNVCYMIKLVIRIRMTSFVLQEKCFGFTNSIKNITNLANFGKWISLQSIGGVMFATMDKVFVGWLFGSSELTRYSICIQVVQFCHSIQAAAFQIITPWAAQKKNAWKAAYAKFNFLKFSLCVGFSSLILPFILIGCSRIILELWMGVAFATNNVDLLRLLLVGMAILAFTIPAHYVLLGLGKAKFSAILLFIAGLASLICSASLAGFGLMGFAFGRMMYGAIACLYLVPISRINYQDTYL